MAVFPLKAGLVAALAFGAFGTFAAAAAAAETEPSILFPDDWGVRLPGSPGQPSREVSTWIAGWTGDVTIEYTVAPKGWAPDAPRVARLYSFFQKQLVFSQSFPNEMALRDSEDLRRVRAATSPAAGAGLLFLYPIELGRPIQDSFARLAKTGTPPAVAIRGRIETRTIFDPGRPSVFGPNYVLTGPSGEIRADTVFVEIFNRPTTVSPRFDSGQPLPSERWKNVQAVGLAFSFYPLSDGTLLGVDAERRVVVRFDARLNSPFFARDGFLAAIDGERFREWIAEAETKATPRGKIPDADATDRYLAKRIVQAGRNRK